jgi:hypothetical protein
MFFEDEVCPLDLLRTGELADVEVAAFGQSFQLHRAYLLRSPFFRNRFSGPWANSQRDGVFCVDLGLDERSSGFGIDALKSCWQYFYGGGLAVASDTPVAGAGEEPGAQDPGTRELGKRDASKREPGTQEPGTQQKEQEWFRDVTRPDLAVRRSCLPGQDVLSGPKLLEVVLCLKFLLLDRAAQQLLLAARHGLPSSLQGMDIVTLSRVASHHRLDLPELWTVHLMILEVELPRSPEQLPNLQEDSLEALLRRPGLRVKNDATRLAMALAYLRSEHSTKNTFSEAEEPPVKRLRADLPQSGTHTNTAGTCSEHLRQRLFAQFPSWDLALDVVEHAREQGIVPTGILCDWLLTRAKQTERSELVFGLPQVGGTSMDLVARRCFTLGLDVRVADREVAFWASPSRFSFMPENIEVTQQTRPCRMAMKDGDVGFLLHCPLDGWPAEGNQRRDIRRLVKEQLFPELPRERSTRMHSCVNYDAEMPDGYEGLIVCVAQYCASVNEAWASLELSLEASYYGHPAHSFRARLPHASTYNTGSALSFYMFGPVRVPKGRGVFLRICGQTFVPA